MSKPTIKRSWVEVIVWSFVSALVAAFPWIYYQFSHGMRSAYMTFAFLVPLALLAFDFVIAIRGKDSGGYGRVFLNSGAASLTLYLLLMGVYEMASNYNEGTPAFLYGGIALILTGLVLSFIHLFKKAPEAVKEEKPS